MQYFRSEKIEILRMYEIFCVLDVTQLITEKKI